MGRIRSRVCVRACVCLYRMYSHCSWPRDNWGRQPAHQADSIYREAACVCDCVYVNQKKNTQMYVTTYTHKHIFTPRPPPLHSLTSLLCQSESWAHWHLNWCKHNMFTGSVLIITKCVSDWVHNPHSHAHTNGAEDLVCGQSVYATS